MLDSAIKEQLKGLFAQLDAHYTFDIFVHPRHESRAELVDLLEEVASCSEKLSCRLQESEGLKFILLKEGEDTGITFRAVPGGHEFTSLLMAILNADGKGKNFPDEFITRRIRALRGPINLTTYLSLGCTNCPDVVQALNLMVVLNPQIRHEAVDGAVNEEEVNRMKVQAVPTVFADGEQIHVGRGNIGDLLEKLEVRYGASVSESFETKEYDVLVAGGGPAGAAAAIYSARKGLRVAVVAERIGGQVNETMGIENLISVPRTTGKELAQDLKSHLAAYHIDILENRRIEKAEVVGEMKVLSVKGGESYKAPVLIIATGANWRKLNVPGEEKYIGHGVAFCPHCDGPFYKGKEVAVIGGGNSGVEAAIDLAGICSKVTVFEFMETLKADTVLQEKVRSLPNVDIFTHTQTVEVLGDGDKVVGMIKKDRSSDKEEIFALDGIFVQIGLTANNPQIRHEAVDGAVNEEEVNRMKVQAVPTVFADGEQIHVGRGNIGDLLEKLEVRYGASVSESFETKEYDVLVAGGGPAGAAAAIYSARKGLRVAVVAERIGGQVNETMGIENLISVPRTTGKELAQDLKSHLAAYHIDILENRRIEKAEVVGEMKVLSVKGGESYKAPVLIIATGANWRKLNVPGEEKYIGHGVAFCPHCDGPFYKGKEVAVIGGGNSGVEAAIDLAGICSKVTVFEFMETLKADTVLQEKVRSLPNVDIFTHTQTVEVLGDGDKVVGMIKKDRSSDKEEIFALDGIFVQIGLTANSALFKDLVETNRMGEILTDKNGRTSVKGIYAAGDVTDISYKQIIIAMGEGAKAALAAFEDRMRGEVG